jgi:hypothetical protein
MVREVESQKNKPSALYLLINIVHMKLFGHMYAA